MNTTKQFWVLLKCQPIISPGIWFLLPVFVLIICFQIGFNFDSGHNPRISILLYNQFAMFIGVFGIMWLVPESFGFGSAESVWSARSEFILTRAIDRRLLYRSRIAIFYGLILSLPLTALLTDLAKPDLHLTEYHKIRHQQILSLLPESIPAPPDKRGETEEITVPNGNILIGSWNLSIFLFIAICTQVLVLLIYPLKYARVIFFVIYMGCCFFPTFSNSFNAKNFWAENEQLYPDEMLFLSWVPHQLLFWSLLIIALITGLLWCERRFVRLEQ